MARRNQKSLGGQRGVALIVVLTAVAVLSVAVSEFSYNTRIAVGMTYHSEKEVQAYFNARSGIMIALFTLEAKEVVDKVVGQFASVLGGVNTNQIEIWRAIEPLCGGFSTGRFNLYGMDLIDFEGVGGMGMPSKQGFECKVDLEDGRINLNNVTNTGDKQTLYSELRGVFMQQFQSDLFDENEKRVDELIASIIDWADQDDNKTQVEQGFIQEAMGGSGEGGDYSKYGYDVKNAKYDTVEELRYVDGVTDGIYCLLKDKVTVYNTEKLNVNTADLEVIKGLVCSHMPLEAQLGLCNPRGRAQGQIAPIDIIGQHFEMCRQVKNKLFTPPFSSAKSFVNFFNKLSAFLQAMPGGGLPGGLPLDTASLIKKVGTKGRVWRVTATGKAGNVEKTITAVLDTSAGKIVYWRE
jgi:type II secretory pathway component PulK